MRCPRMRPSRRANRQREGLEGDEHRPIPKARLRLQTATSWASRLSHRLDRAARMNKPLEERILYRTYNPLNRRSSGVGRVGDHRPCNASGRRHKAFNIENVLNPKSLASQRSMVGPTIYSGRNPAKVSIQFALTRPSHTYGMAGVGHSGLKNPSDR